MYHYSEADVNITLLSYYQLQRNVIINKKDKLCFFVTRRGLNL